MNRYFCCKDSTKSATHLLFPGFLLGMRRLSDHTSFYLTSQALSNSKGFG